MLAACRMSDIERRWPKCDAAQFDRLERVGREQQPDIMDDVTISEVGTGGLSDYSSIPIAYQVRSILRAELVAQGLDGIRLAEVALPAPYIKDYDSYDDGPPTSWPRRFDMTSWGILLALNGERPVGGATIAHDAPDIQLLRGRRDLALLWDIRVRPELRSRGIGTMLLQRAAEWAHHRGCGQLKIETQNVNVAACRFYASRGCYLGEIDRFGYVGHPEVGDEVMLVWYLDL
jgi:GNAT superfamily N-acetyltransferase